MSANLNLSKLLKFMRLLLPAIVWGSFITVLSIVPGGTFQVKNFWNLITFDKFGHLGFYAIFSYLLAVGVYKQHTYKAIRYHGKIYVLCFAVLFGFFQEMIQYFGHEGRTAEFADMVANSIGALIGLGIFHLIFNKVLKEN